MSTLEDNNRNFDADQNKPVDNINKDTWRQEGSPTHRLSDYDEGNETDKWNGSRTEESFTIDKSQDKVNIKNSEFQDSSSHPNESEESKYENSYGMGSDSSRSLLSEGNEMVFGNDREGQNQDDAYNGTKLENDEWNNGSGSDSSSDSKDRE